jgi:hypothetical protein
VLSFIRSKPKKTPTWREMLELRPVRNPGLDWTEEEGHVVLHVKHASERGTGSWKYKIINLLVPVPPERRVGLDPIGTDVWHLMNGENTVGSIARELAKKYKLQPREAEISLQQFFKELGRRGYIGFMQPEASQEAPERKKRKKN